MPFLCNPPNLSWLGTGTKYAGNGMHTQLLGCQRYDRNPKIQKWVTWPWPRPFRSSLSSTGMAYQYTKFENCRFNCSRGMNTQNAKTEVTSGHSKCPHLMHITSYSPFIQKLSIYLTLFLTYSKLFVEDANFSYPCVFGTPLWMTQLKFIKISDIRKPDSQAIMWQYFCDAILSHFDKTPSSDRHISTDHASIA